MQHHAGEGVEGVPRRGAALFPRRKVVMQIAQPGLVQLLNVAQLAPGQHAGEHGVHPLDRTHHNTHFLALAHGEQRGDELVVEGAALGGEHRHGVQGVVEGGDGLLVWAR
ncbi:methionine-tRNA ligase [Babesia caballi]|uniref:Methionine-tRNA ligase n=1 Tax=Babesia caballi TaxID=5871 RepID=A0AAV4LZ87_BABCB|nr:methionine-tRNA ligase [Babesia caballi]